jgi:hypothetical protein
MEAIHAGFSPPETKLWPSTSSLFDPLPRPSTECPPPLLPLPSLIPTNPSLHVRPSQFRRAALFPALILLREALPYALRTLPGSSVQRPRVRLPFRERFHGPASTSEIGLPGQDPFEKARRGYLKCVPRGVVRASILDVACWERFDVWRR